MLRIIGLVCNLFKTEITDLSVAFLTYAIISVVFHKDFDYRILAIAVIFSIAPDMDFIPYLVLRKRYNLVSHHFIHFPLLWIAAGAPVFLYSPYLAVFAVFLPMAHIMRDSAYPTGIMFFYPFFKTHYRWDWKSIQFINAEESRRIRLEEVRTFKGGERTLLDEVTIRSERLEEWKIVFFASSIMLTMLYAFLFSS